MNSMLDEQMVQALALKFEGLKQAHIVNIRTLLNNGVGVAEHPDSAATIEGELAKVAEYDDKLAALNFDRYQSWSAAQKISNDSQPALYVFQGDVYQGLQAETFDKKDIDSPIATSEVVVVCFDFDNQKPVPVFDQILKDYNA